MSATQDVAGGTLRIVPLGGLGEIGKNMWIVETADDLVVLDCGFAFPTEEMYGVDLVLPDYSYVLEREAKLRAVVLTHGHEDHIGGVPFFYKQLTNLDVPVFGTPLTMGLVESKLREHGGLRDRVPLVRVRPREVVKAGDLSLEFMQVCHSIADGIGVAVHTSRGTVVYTGDFKLDQTPIDGRSFDYFKFAEMGERGALVLLSDSTNATREGYTPSEAVVGEALDQAFHKARQRLIIATFASNIHRIQQILDASARYGRKVALMGRSLQKVSEQAANLGYLNLPPDTMIKVDQVKDYPDHEVTVVTTGSQGEPMSGLSRLARGDQKHLELRQGDTVLISAVPIPGNEMLVSAIINKLMERGADVLYESERTNNAGSCKHVSGHASREELKIMLNLVRPKYFIPVHGELRHLVAHAQLATAVNVPADRVFVGANGDIFEFDEAGARVAGQVNAEAVLIDGSMLRDMGPGVLKDRRQLAREGVVTAVLTMDDEGYLLDGPDLVSQGFVADLAALSDDAKSLMVDVLGRCRDEACLAAGTVRERIGEALKEFLYQRTRRKPVLFTLVHKAPAQRHAAEPGGIDHGVRGDATAADHAPT